MSSSFINMLLVLTGMCLFILLYIISFFIKSEKRKSQLRWSALAAWLFYHIVIFLD